MPEISKETADEFTKGFNSASKLGLRMGGSSEVPSQTQSTDGQRSVFPKKPSDSVQAATLPTKP